MTVVGEIDGPTRLYKYSERAMATKARTGLAPLFEVQVTMSINCFRGTRYCRKSGRYIIHLTYAGRPDEIN